MTRELEDNYYKKVYEGWKKEYHLIQAHPHLAGPLKAHCECLIHKKQKPRAMPTQGDNWFAYEQKEKK